MNAEEPIFHGVTWNKASKEWSGWIKIGDEDRHLVSHEVEDHVAELVRKETTRLRNLGHDVDKRFGQLLEGLQQVEQILGIQFSNNRIEFHVKWLDEEETTWEPQENICSCDAFHEFTNENNYKNFMEKHQKNLNYHTSSMPTSSNKMRLDSSMKKKKKKKKKLKISSMEKEKKKKRKKKFKNKKPFDHNSSETSPVDFTLTFPERTKPKKRKRDEDDQESEKRRKISKDPLRIMQGRWILNQGLGTMKIKGNGGTCRDGELTIQDLKVIDSNDQEGEKGGETGRELKFECDVVDKQNEIIGYCSFKINNHKMKFHAKLAFPGVRDREFIGQRKEYMDIMEGRGDPEELRRKHKVRRKRACKTSKYVGVSWNTASQKWQITRSINGKKYTGGYHINEIEAGRISDMLIRQNCSSIMLPKMTLNFPDDESYAKAVQGSETSHVTNYQTQIDSTMCMKCGKGDEEAGFLLCDFPAGQEHGAHLHCVGLEDIPSGTWYCPNHLTKEQREKEATKTIKKQMKRCHWSRDEDETLIEMVTLFQLDLTFHAKKIPDLLPRRSLAACKSRWNRLKTLDTNLEKVVMNKIKVGTNKDVSELLENMKKRPKKEKKDETHECRYVGVIWNKEQKIWEGIIEGKICTTHVDERECAGKLREHVQTLKDFGVPIDEKYGKLEPKGDYVSKFEQNVKDL